LEIERSAQMALLRRGAWFKVGAVARFLASAASLFHTEMAGSKAKYFGKSAIFLC
jgi:hypothetical protein